MIGKTTSINEKADDYTLSNLMGKVAIMNYVSILHETYSEYEGTVMILEEED